MTRPSASFLRGRRIDPKAITGRETAADLIDNAFLAYNAGRLREGCLLFSQRMLADDSTVGMSLTGAHDAGGPRHELAHSAHGSRVRGLDHLDRRQSLPRRALRAGPLAAPGHPHRRRRRAPREGRGADLRHLLRLLGPALDRRLRARSVGPAGVPAPDEHGGVPLPAGRVPARSGRRPSASIAARSSRRPTRSRCRSTPARRATAPSA